MKINSFSLSELKYPIESQQGFDEIDFIGNIELIRKPLLAVFSSVKCPACMILKAHDFSKEIRDSDLGIISGFHAPAEQEVLAVLLKGKCPLIIVLGRRLENARISLVWREELEKGRLLVISPFAEHQAYVNKEMSLKRNDLAARIANHVLVLNVSTEGRLRDQIAKWKLDGIKIDNLT